MSRSSAARVPKTARALSETALILGAATPSTNRLTASATRTSMREKPRRARPRAAGLRPRVRLRNTVILGAIRDRHEIFDRRRALLGERDPIQRALGPLDVRDQLADRMAAQAPVELVALEQRERREHAVFRGAHPVP